jgi:hypothetical protein
MPKWFPSYTNCSAPSDYSGVAAWAMALLAAIGLGAGILLGVLTSAFSPAAAIVLAGVCLAGIVYCNWWLNVRLICLGGDRSGIGVIYQWEPPPGQNLLSFDLGDYDTDYSFSILQWPFVPQHELPDSFVANQWAPNALSQLEAEWPALPPLVPSVTSISTVHKQVELMTAQQTMASLGLSFSGLNVNDDDQPKPTPQHGSSQHFLLHCEIEGAGIRDFRTLLWILFGTFLAAAAVYAIPVIGPILSWLLMLLALLMLIFGSYIARTDTASPPDSTWGSSLVGFDSTADRNTQVDIVYVFGRWIYDSLHTGWNELHPLHFLIKIGTATQGDLSQGVWPADLGDRWLRLDAIFAGIGSASSAVTQAEPQNQWTLHPAIDGCLGTTPYPDPDPNVVIK